MKDFDYRYMVYNTSKKEYQFMKICTETKKAAENLLFKFIGNDARKMKFEIRKLPKRVADEIRLDGKINSGIKVLNKYLDCFDKYELENLIKENEKRRKIFNRDTRIRY